MAQNLNRHYSKEDKQMANKFVNRCSILLVIRETQVKATMRYHFLPIRKRNTHMHIEINHCWQECGEIGTLCMADGDVKR